MDSLLPAMTITLPGKTAMGATAVDQVPYFCGVRCSFTVAFQFIRSALRFIEECAKVRDMLRRWAVDTSQVKDKSAWTVPAKKKEEGLMKKQSFLMAGLLVLSSMAATQVARAQESMVVDIPFAFTAGNATLPAGEYRVQKLGENSVVVLIRCSDASASAMVLSNAAQAKK